MAVDTPKLAHFVERALGVRLLCAYASTEPMEYGLRIVMRGEDGMAYIDVVRKVGRDHVIYIAETTEMIGGLRAKKFVSTAMWLHGDSSSPSEYTDPYAPELERTLCMLRRVGNPDIAAL